MGRKLVCVPLFCALILSGCAHLPNSDGLYQEPAPPWLVEQNNDHLSSISSLIEAGKGNAAKQEADLINFMDLTDPQKARFNLLYAQILLSFGEAEQAVSKLATIETEQLTSADKIKFNQSRAFAYSLTGNLMESAKARIELDSLLTKTVERKKNQGIILESLGLLPQTFAQNQEAQTPKLPEWLSIAKILASKHRNPASFNAALAEWRIANPEHPANLYVETVENVPDAGITADMPESIAVFLPNSGPYVGAAKALKAGFLAAYNHDISPNKPELHFYDTVKAKLPGLYQKAIDEGAKLVIGPLNKESIQSLANTANLSIPVLALNHVPNLSRPNLYQFGLSPLDDVAEITQKAQLDGYKKAILLVPNNDQGKRLSNYFVENWQMLGGTVLKKLTYDPSKKDFSTALNSLTRFHQSASDNESIPVFLSAYDKEGRSLNSQLKKAGHFPVYALPTIYSGLPDSINDGPLNGITFCDTPWLFNGAYNGALSIMALRDILHQFPSSYIRLVAMGIDAYQLVGKLKDLSTTPYSGATGNLSLVSDNRIKRNLVCAKFAKGQPELIGFSRSPAESDYSGDHKQVGMTAPIQ